MKKVLFLFTFFLLTASGGWKAGNSMPAPESEAVVLHHAFGDTQMPLGDGEEKPGEEDKDITDDDDVSLDHGDLCRDDSSCADLRFLYQEKLFRNLEKEVVIQPPRA